MSKSKSIEREHRESFERIERVRELVREYSFGRSVRERVNESVSVRECS